MTSMSSIDLALAYQCISPCPSDSFPCYVGNLHIVGHEERSLIISVHGQENLEWMLESREAQRQLFQDQLGVIKNQILYVQLRVEF